MSLSLSRDEQTRLVQMRLERAIAEKELVDGISFYIFGANDEDGDFILGAHFVSREEEPDEDEEGNLEHLLRGTDFTYCDTHPVPPAERVIEGDDLIVSNEVRAAAAAFIAWWDKQYDLDGENPPVCIFPGAFLTVEEDLNRSMNNVAVICFPASSREFHKSRLRSQAQFATALIQLLNRKMDVVINGYRMPDVIPEISAIKLANDYMREFGDHEEAVIEHLVNLELERLREQTAALQTWKLKRQSLLPEGHEVLSCTDGILSYLSGDGLAVISADDEEDLPEDLLDQLFDMCE